MLIHDYPNPPDWNEPLKEAPKCPVCGKEAETFYEKDGQKHNVVEVVVTGIDFPLTRRTE